MNIHKSIKIRFSDFKQFHRFPFKSNNLTLLDLYKSKDTHTHISNASSGQPEVVGNISHDWPNILTTKVIDLSGHLAFEKFQ